MQWEGHVLVLDHWLDRGAETVWVEEVEEEEEDEEGNVVITEVCVPYALSYRPRIS